MLLSFLAAPRQGHLKQALHIFSYLKKKHNGVLVFDPVYPEIENASFQTHHDWTEFYGKDPIPNPPNMPDPCGKEVNIQCFVDTYHVDDKITRCSRTGVTTFLNNAPIYWLSNKQTNIKNSTFGSEFFAMKHATDYIRGLMYKLKMMCIPVNEPAFVYGDNMSVTHNTTLPV